MEDRGEKRLGRKSWREKKVERGEEREEKAWREEWIGY